RIVTPDGVERLETVRIGGVDPAGSVRGAGRRNPPPPLVPGGPGFASPAPRRGFGPGGGGGLPVVHRGQRGAGKTHLLTDPAAVAPTLTLEQMAADAEEVAAWVRATLGKEKIVLLGHSWGSHLGLRLAQRRPAWLHAYVGVAQVADAPEGERRG